MKKALLIISMIFATHCAIAGNEDGAKTPGRTVTGRITDQFGNPIAGAVINIVESGEQFFADLEGHYKLVLKTDKKYTVRINTLGYRPLDLPSSSLGHFSDVSLLELF